MSEPICYGPWRRWAEPQLIVAPPARPTISAGWIPALLLFAFVAGLTLGRIIP